MLSQHIPQLSRCLVLVGAEERGEVADVELRHLQGVHLAQLLGLAPRLLAARHGLAQPLESLVEAVHPLALAVVGVPPPLPDPRGCQPQLLQLPGGQRLVLPAPLVTPEGVPVAGRQVLLGAGGGVEAAAGAQVAAEVCLHGVTGHPGVTGVVRVPGTQLLTPGVQVTPGVHGGAVAGVAQVEAVSEGGEGGEILLGLGLEAGLAWVGLVVVVVCGVVGCHGEDTLHWTRVGARLRLGAGRASQVTPSSPCLRPPCRQPPQPAPALAGRGRHLCWHNRVFFCELLTNALPKYISIRQYGYGHNFWAK